VHQVGDESLDFACHIESMSPSVVNDTGGIEKPRCLRRKPKFLRMTCEGDHLTQLCPTTVGLPEAWGSPKGPSSSEAPVVSPHPVSSLIDMAVISLQSSHDLAPIFDGDVSPIHVTMNPLQPKIEEVVAPMQSLVNPTLLPGSDASFNHVVSILDPTPSK
jgi:hypothetical protein